MSLEVKGRGQVPIVKGEVEVKDVMGLDSRLLFTDVVVLFGVFVVVSLRGAFAAVAAVHSVAYRCRKLCLDGLTVAVNQVEPDIAKIVGTHGISWSQLHVLVQGYGSGSPCTVSISPLSGDHET